MLNGPEGKRGHPLEELTLCWRGDFFNKYSGNKSRTVLVLGIFNSSLTQQSCEVSLIVHFRDKENRLREDKWLVQGHKAKPVRARIEAHAFHHIKPNAEGNVEDHQGLI